MGTSQLVGGIAYSWIWISIERIFGVSHRKNVLEKIYKIFESKLLEYLGMVKPETRKPAASCLFWIEVKSAPVTLRSLCHDVDMLSQIQLAKIKGHQAFEYIAPINN